MVTATPVTGVTGFPAFVFGFFLRRAAIGPKALLLIELRPGVSSLSRPTADSDQ